MIPLLLKITSNKRVIPRAEIEPTRRTIILQSNKEYNRKWLDQLAYLTQYQTRRRVTSVHVVSIPGRADCDPPLDGDFFLYLLQPTDLVITKLHPPALGYNP